MVGIVGSDLLMLFLLNGIDAQRRQKLINKRPSGAIAPIAPLLIGSIALLLGPIARSAQLMGISNWWGIGYSGTHISFYWYWPPIESPHETLNDHTPSPPRGGLYGVPNTFFRKRFPKKIISASRPSARSLSFFVSVDVDTTASTLLTI